MIYLTGDIHGDISRIMTFIEEQQLGKDDMIILLGDVGLNFWGNNHSEKKKKAILNDTGVTFLCVHGNHEMRPYTIKSYGEKIWKGGMVYEEFAFPNIKFLKDGEVYELEGAKFIAIGGAYSVDKYYRIANRIPWFPDEQPSEEVKLQVEEKLDDLGWKVDFVLSHTCPEKYVPTEAFMPGLPQESVDHSTELWLDSIEDRLTYTCWYCGHWHINKHIDKLHFLMECYEVLPKNENV